jgi:hypothetical protein
MNEDLRLRYARRWIHAREEDTTAGIVYRPDGVPLPPARGREVLDLRSDGTCSYGTPGPDDRRRFTEGRWRLEAANALMLELDGRPATVLTVVEVSGERMVVGR